MKLAEALVRRADIQKRVEQLRERLKLSVLVQEGEQPPEDPRELLAELDRLLDELSGLIAQINRTNLAAALPDGTTLTEALAQRDVLKLRQSVLKSTADATVNPLGRYSRSEIKSVAAIDVAALRQRVDEVARQYRQLDTAIQALNWAIELVA